MYRKPKLLSLLLLAGSLSVASQGMYAAATAPGGGEAASVRSGESEPGIMKESSFLTDGVSSVGQAKSQYEGIVIDAKTGDVLIGVSVSIKGTSTGVVTDLDGRFSLQASEGQTLVFSYIGYVSKEVKLAKTKLLSVELAEDSKLLDEVVITAFGTGQKKESVTGAIQSVRPSDLKVPTSNLSNSFAGRLAGVVAYQRSGEPGSNGSNFYIRGISTMSGVTSPLLIMDGVEISTSDLNSVDPEVIESFSILKDATATAMYGTRGANGVMIIKTKSGADLDKPAIGFRVESYINQPIRKQKFVDGATYMKMYNEAVTNQGTGSVLFTQAQMDGVAAGTDPYIYPNVDWYSEIFKDVTFNQKANFNIRGGTSKITYFMNLNMNHETGMLQNNSRKYYSYDNNIDLMKYSFQNNIDFNLSKSSKIGLHLNVQLNDYTGPYNSVSDIFTQIMNNNPVDYPIEFPNTLNDGDWVHWGAYSGGNEQGAANPMAYATQGYKDYTESTVIANIDFDQNLDFITKGLSFKALFSFKNWSKTTTSRYQGYNKYYLTGYSKNDDGTYNYDITAMGEPSRHSLTTDNSTEGDRKFYFQSYLNYDRTFGSDHNLSAMLLWNLEQYDSNAPSDLITSLPQRKMGFAMRAAYDYKHRYMLEFNAGYNGSENFAAGHRWGFFPSISAGWNLSEERFWEPIKHIFSNLKLRASYGLVGNDQLLDSSGNQVRYMYLAQVDLTGSDSYQTGYGSNFASHSGPVYTRFQNDDITWEVGHKFNAGVDMQLFNSLNITLEAFQEIRSNIFQEKNSIPNYFGTGSTTIYGNLAKVKNWGAELSVDYGKQFSKDFSMQLKGTFTFSRNKILEYDEGAGTRTALSYVGKKLNSIWGYVADGLFIDEADIANSPTSTLGNITIAPGDIKYVDQPDNDGNYDGQITSDDRVVIGNPTVPEIVYGFGPSFVYKNWDFSFFFQGQAKVSLMMSDFEPFGSGYNRNVLSWIAEDYWSVDNQNPNAAHPRLTQYVNENNTVSSTYWLRNAAFLKLKNIELGYTWKKARFYVSGANVLTFSPFKLWDPEMGGGKGLSYPTQRTFNIGVQVSL